MARVPISELIFQGANPVKTAPGRQVFVYKRGTETQATLYAAETGETTVVQPLTTDTAGLPTKNGDQVWVEAGEYDLKIGSQSAPLTTGGLPDSVGSKSEIEAKTAVVSLADFGADPTGATDSTAALNEAIAALPLSGGRVLCPPGWYLIDGAVCEKFNIEIIGHGSPGNGVSGAYGAKSFSGTAFVGTASGGRIVNVGAATGGVDYRGTTFRNVAFVDGSEAKDMECGPYLRRFNFNRFVDCTWLNFKSGKSIGYEGDVTNFSQWNSLLRPQIYSCKVGIPYLGPDLEVVGGFVKGAANGAASPIAGGVGLEVKSDVRVFGTGIYNNDTDILVKGTNNQIYVRVETSAAFTTTNATNGLVFEGAEAEQNTINAHFTNTAKYTAKAILLKSGVAKNTIITPLLAASITNESGVATNLILNSEAVQSLAPLAAALTADLAPIKESTTLTAITGLSFPVGASTTEVWRVKAMLLIEPANSEMDIKIGWTVPAGVGGRWGSHAGSAATVAGWSEVAVATAGVGMVAWTSAQSIGSSTGGIQGVMVEGILVGGGTSGTAQLKIAQNTSNAGELKVLKGSLLEATKVTN
jgi:hypothetical protein